jgi:hypothetical protein
LPGTGTGRRRIYCSNACRQRAYRTRQSTSGDEAAPQPSAVEPTHSPAPNEPTPLPTTHDLDACIIAVLQTPNAIASVLDVVRRAARDGVLDQPEFADVQTALIALTDGRDRDLG